MAGNMVTKCRLFSRSLLLSGRVLQRPCTSSCVASQITSGIRTVQCRAFSRTFQSDDVESLDQETEKKAGWMLKGIAAVTIVCVGMNVYPLMGDSMVKHSVALLRTRDPFFKRSGASRLTLIATDDAKRLRIVNAGAVVALVDMLESASDDETRREAVKALASLSPIDAAIEALDGTRVEPVLRSLLASSLDLEAQERAAQLLYRWDAWKTRKNQ